MKEKAFWTLHKMTLTKVEHIKATENVSTPHKITVNEVFFSRTVGLNFTRLPLAPTSASTKGVKKLDQ